MIISLVTTNKETVKFSNEDYDGFDKVDVTVTDSNERVAITEFLDIEDLYHAVKAFRDRKIAWDEREERMK